MSKEPLYPHTPKSRQPKFPHMPGGRQPAETAGLLPVVIVVCPICSTEIDIPEFNFVTRTDALIEHLKKEHPSFVGQKILPMVIIDGGESVSPQYRHLTGLVSEPIPDYSLLTSPAVVPRLTPN